jgi:hypothetical protein
MYKRLRRKKLRLEAQAVLEQEGFSTTTSLTCNAESSASVACLTDPIAKPDRGARSTVSIPALRVRSESHPIDVQPDIPGDESPGAPIGPESRLTLSTDRTRLGPGPSQSLMQVPGAALADNQSVASAPALAPASISIPRASGGGSLLLAPDHEPAKVSRSAPLEPGLLSPISGLIEASNERLRDILSLAPPRDGRALSVELNGDDELDLAPLRNVVCCGGVGYRSSACPRHTSLFSFQANACMAVFILSCERAAEQSHIPMSCNGDR